MKRARAVHPLASAPTTPSAEGLIPALRPSKERGPKTNGETPTIASRHFVVKTKPDPRGFTHITILEGPMLYDEALELAAKYMKQGRGWNYSVAEQEKGP